MQNVSKTVSETPHDMSNKIKEKIPSHCHVRPFGKLCFCSVRNSYRLCLKKGVKLFGKIENKYITKLGASI